MKLERLLELEVDLPDAPDGCVWMLLNADSVWQVGLRTEDGVDLGFMTGGATGSVMATIHQPEAEVGRYVTFREAALALFAALGLEAK